MTQEQKDTILTKLDADLGALREQVAETEILVNAVTNAPVGEQPPAVPAETPPA